MKRNRHGNEFINILIVHYGQDFGSPTILHVKAIGIMKKKRFSLQKSICVNMTENKLNLILALAGVWYRVSELGTPVVYSRPGQQSMLHNVVKYQFSLNILTQNKYKWICFLHQHQYIKCFFINYATKYHGCIWILIWAICSSNLFTSKNNWVATLWDQFNELRISIIFNKLFRLPNFWEKNVRHSCTIKKF